LARQSQPCANYLLVSVIVAAYDYWRDAEAALAT
jgi:hypothetical protein